MFFDTLDGNGYKVIMLNAQNNKCILVNLPWMDSLIDMI